MLIARSDVDINKVVDDSVSFAGRGDFLKLVLNHPNIDINSKKLISDVCFNEDVDSLLKILNNPKFDGESLLTGLNESCARGNVKIVNLFLRLIPHNFTLNESLDTAILVNNSEIVQLLLDDGRIEVPDHNWWCIKFCKTHNQHTIIDILTKHYGNKIVFN
jgi:ankyrin repeat protein